MQQHNIRGGQAKSDNHATVVKLYHYILNFSWTHGQSGQVEATVLWSCCKGKCRTASTDCPRRKYGRNTLSRQTKKTMAQWHRRLDGVQVHSAKDVSGQTAMQEEDTGMVSCCRQPSEEEGRLERERLNFPVTFAYLIGASWFCRRIVTFWLLRLIHCRNNLATYYVSEWLTDEFLVDLASRSSATKTTKNGWVNRKLRKFAHPRNG